MQCVGGCEVVGEVFGREACGEGGDVDAVEVEGGDVRG